MAAQRCHFLRQHLLPLVGFGVFSLQLAQLLLHDDRSFVEGSDTLSHRNLHSFLFLHVRDDGSQLYILLADLLSLRPQSLADKAWRRWLLELQLEGLFPVSGNFEGFLQPESDAFNTRHLRVKRIESVFPRLNSCGNIVLQTDLFTL